MSDYFSNTDKFLIFDHMIKQELFSSYLELFGIADFKLVMLASSVSFTFGMMQENKEDSFKLPRRFFANRGKDFLRCDFVKELPAAEDFEIDAQSTFVEFVSAFSCFVGDDFGAGMNSGMIGGIFSDEYSLDLSVFGISLGSAGISCTFWGFSSSDF